MNKRRIGRSDLQVAPLAFGGNVFGWTADETMSFKLLDEFVGQGFDLVDTADVYSAWAPGNHGGESETIIGRWLKRSGNRDKIVLATKCGMAMAPTLGKKSLAKKYIFSAVDDSLKRLQVDHIDLYQAHTDDADTPLEETLDAFTQLIKQGKVRVIGASNYKGKRLLEALHVSERNKLARYECLQPEYNLYDRPDYEQDLEQVCSKNEIGVITYFSLARGFLSGKYRSPEDLGKSPRGEGVKKYLNDRGTRILAALDKVAREYKSTPARVSLAWLIARPSVTAPIASATSTEQLGDLIEAAKLTLDKATIEFLNEASEYQASSVR